MLIWALVRAVQFKVLTELKTSLPLQSTNKAQRKVMKINNLQKEDFFRFSQNSSWNSKKVMITHIWHFEITDHYNKNTILMHNITDIVLLYLNNPYIWVLVL